MQKEATITVNGIQLNEAQAGAVRVAVASMLMELAESEDMKSLGEIGPLYQARLSEVQVLILNASAEQVSPTDVVVAHDQTAGDGQLVELLGDDIPEHLRDPHWRPKGYPFK